MHVDLPVSTKYSTLSCASLVVYLPYTLLDVELSLPVYQVRIALILPSQLSGLGSSVVEYLPSKQCVVGSSPT